MNIIIFRLSLWNPVEVIRLIVDGPTTIGVIKQMARDQFPNFGPILGIKFHWQHQEGTHFLHDDDIVGVNPNAVHGYALVVGEDEGEE